MSALPEKLEKRPAEPLGQKKAKTPALAQLVNMGRLSVCDVQVK